MILMDEPSTLSTAIIDQYHRVTGAGYVYREQSCFNYQKLVLQTLFEEYEAARETAFEMIILRKTYKDFLFDPLANCYLSLVLLAVCGQAPEGEKEQILTQVHDNQDTLEKLARCAPSNYLHKHHLVEAERLRILDGQSDAILSHYDQAIALARESEFIHEEALANELAARYLLNQGRNNAASSYLRSAMEKYEAWGAKRKVAHLKSRYPGLIADDRAEAASPSANLDLGTMLKASEPISSTLELEPLLEILLGILIENAGAQTAALLLETEGRSLIAACGSAEQVECFLPLSLPVEKAQSLSLSVISRVKQTREHLVLDNASREERFVEDDYIKQERPKSILCAPIIHKSSLSGIIYLENNLVEGAFTPRQLEVIKHLTTQIAISLENARLHENLKKALDELKESESSLREENVRLKANIKDRFRFGDIIGKSEPMQQVYELILRAAATDVNVILYGESGTGKELVSRAIHDASDRKEQVFFPVNLGAISENLIESEFFGHKKGAFTGADNDKQGFLHLTDKGTLFLDELADIGLNLQVKLLRVLEGSGLTPVGTKEVIKPNIRFIAASNQELSHLVKTGQIREDFYYRIHVLPIRLPPLGERKEDIPLLVEHFLKSTAPLQKGKPITPGFLEALQGYDWPGNVRELQNTLHRYVSLGEVDFLGERINSKISETSNFGENTNHRKMALDQAVADSEKATIINALKNYEGHKVKTAAALGISRTTLFNKMKKYGIRTSTGT